MKQHTKLFLCVLVALAWLFDSGESAASLAFLHLLAGLISGGAGLIGGLSQMSAAERAQLLREKGVKEWLDINIPNPEEQKLALEKFVVAGELSPHLETAVKQDPSAFEAISEDPGLRASKLRALRSLESLGTGEATFADKAAQEEALIDQAARSRGNQKAIMSSLASRGQLGTGLELASRMDQNQADADMGAKTTLGLEANRRANALKAIQGAGSLAGDMADDDYRISSDAARAKDAISNFNATNLQNVNSANTRALNSADQWNLTNRQDISNKNTAQNNYEQQYNKELLQKEFENKAKRAAGVSGQYGDAADSAVKAGDSAAKFWGGLAGTLPKVIDAAGNYGDDEDDEK